MLRFAPRYPPALVAIIIGLDDDRRPIAETWRRIGVAADRLGIERPSYVHVRRIVLVERRRRRERRVDPADALARLLLDVRPLPHRVLGELAAHGGTAPRRHLWLRVTRCLRRRLQLLCRRVL